jgi:hypothetical protein
MGLKDESSDEDQFPLRPTPKIESVVTTLAKKVPLAPTKEIHPVVAEPPKKSVFDLLEDDRRALSEKSALPPPVMSNNSSQDFNFGDQTASNKRPATAGQTKTSLFTDNQESRSMTKPLFETKTDFGISNI